MREKRVTKPKKYLDEEVTPLKETKQKKIKKKQKKDKDSQDGSAENIDVHSIPSLEKENNEKEKKVTAVKKESQDQSQNQMENEQNSIPKKQRQNKKSEQSPLSKLQNLDKLNENYKQIKNIHEQNLAKYNQYKSQCEELSHRVNQSRSKIQKKSQQLRDLSKSIYNQSIRSNKEQFYNQKTFTDSAKFTKFVGNLAIVVQAILKCPYEDPLQFLQVTRIQPGSLIANDKIVPRQHKKEKIVKDYLIDFPYITANSQCIPLIRALIQSSKFIQNSKLNSLLQFPCLFIRKSGLSFSMFEKIKSILFNFIDSDNVKFSQSILKISNEVSKQGQNYSQAIIQELLFKGLNKMRYICLPECQFELRGLSYGGYIYINTYYVQKDSSLTKQACIAYCLLTGIRELVNYVINSLIYSLNKSEEDIGKTIYQFRQRKDLGFKYEVMLTNQLNGFICASSQDIKILKQPSLEKLQFLGKNYTEYGNGFIFQQQRKRQEQITSQILNKYVAHKQVIPHQQINQQYESSNMSQEINNRSSNSNMSNKSMKHILDIKNCNNLSMSIIKQSSFSREAPDFLSQIDPFTGQKLDAIQ